MWFWYLVVCSSWFIPVICVAPNSNNVHALGVEYGLLPENAFNASSQLDDYHRPQLARLNNVKREEDKGGWSAMTNDGHQWITVDLGEKKVVYEVWTQGRQDAQEWVKLFTVGYGDNKNQYKMYRDKLSFTKDFRGNIDNNGIVRNTFNPPIRARFIRIFPCKWHGRISMRLEFRGIPASKPKRKPCPRSFEIGFLIPESRHVEQAGFASQKQFIQSVCSFFQLSKEETHIGLVTYSNKASVKIRFSSFLNNLSAKQAVNLISFANKDGNRVNVGLEAIHNLFKEKGVEHTRRTLLMIVYELKDKKQASKMIEKIHMMGEEEIKAYVVVIGKSLAGIKEVLGYSSGGTRILYFPSFTSLLAHHRHLAQEICKGDESNGNEDH